MDIDVQSLPGANNVTSVSIDGRLDAYTVDRVEEELNSLVRIGSSKLICDLSGVEFVSSSGFKAFRRVIGFAREQDGDLKFCGLSAELMLLFNSVGFGRETGIFATREEALFDFESGGSQNEGGGSSSGIKSKISGLLNSVGFSKESGEAEAPRKQDRALQQTQIFSKDSALKETVIVSRSHSGSRPAAPADLPADRFASIEPVKITLYPEASHFQNLSQLLGTIGSLVGFSSMDLVKLNVAVQEVCRTMVKELESDETFAMEIDSQRPGFRVYIDIPREDYNIYENLQPKTADKPLSGQAGKDWLLDYVDDIDLSPADKGTRYQLSLAD